MSPNRLVLPTESMDAMDARLLKLRSRQDRLNLQIAKLLVKRYRLSKEILALKQSLNLPAYSSLREGEIVDLVTRRTDLSADESRFLTTCFLEFCRLTRNDQG